MATPGEPETAIEDEQALRAEQNRIRPADEPGSDIELADGFDPFEAFSEWRGQADCLAYATF